MATEIDYQPQPYAPSWATDFSPRFSFAGWYASLKVLFDYLVASVLLVLTSPLILASMALVRLTSRGPAIYRQTRLGRDGQPFMIYKIRSMVHDCERESGPCWAKAGDSRITPVGAFLRRTHLDELPQLWNVLRGEMSLVGPRPERPEFVSQLERALPNYRDRVRIRPGITGLAQVQLPADSDLESVRRKLACDLLYIDRMSPTLDLRILAATLTKVLGVSFATSVALLKLPTALVD
jgi:lipopolysaccharide/colanic/teichoic acid biosynthesis glycosyltransferase